MVQLAKMKNAGKTVGKKEPQSQTFSTEILNIFSCVQVMDLLLRKLSAPQIINFQ